MQEVRIDHLHLLREERFRGQRKRFGGERWIAVRKNAPACVEECPRRRAFPVEDDRGGEPLSRLPAVEGIVVACHQVQQLFLGERIVEDQRGGETAQERRNRFALQIPEDKFFFRPLDRQHLFL